MGSWRGELATRFSGCRVSEFRFGGWGLEDQSRFSNVYWLVFHNDEMYVCMYTNVYVQTVYIHVKLVVFLIRISRERWRERRKER